MNPVGPPFARFTFLGGVVAVEAGFPVAGDSRERPTAGPHWEVYYDDPNAEPDPSRWRTDVVVPYSVR